MHCGDICLCDRGRLLMVLAIDNVIVLQTKRTGCSHERDVINI